MIEIHGPVEEYDGRAGIICEEYRQLSAQPPESQPCPRVTTWKRRAATAQERSAAPTAEKKASKKRQTAKLPIEVPEAADKGIRPTFRYAAT